MEGDDNWQSRGRSGRDEEARDWVQWEYAKRMVVGFVSATTRQLRPSHFRVLRVLVNAVGCRLLIGNDRPSRKRHVLDRNSRIASAAILNQSWGFREQRSFGSMYECERVTSSSRSSSSPTYSIVFHDTTHLLDLAWQGCRWRVTRESLTFGAILYQIKQFNSASSSDSTAAYRLRGDRISTPKCMCSNGCGKEESQQIAKW